MKSKSKCEEKSLAKRKLSVKKKASELSTLFNAQVCMVFSGVDDDDDGDFKVWPEDITKAREILLANIEATKNKEKVEEEEEEEVAFEVIDSEQIKNQNAKIKWDDVELNKLSKDSLLALSRSLDAKIQALDERIEFMKLQKPIQGNSSNKMNEKAAGQENGYFGDC